MVTPTRSESELLETLNALQHPDIQSRTLGELGIIQAVQIADNRANVTLALPLRQAPVVDVLINLVKQAIKDANSELEVEVNVTKMTPEQRAAFATVVRGDQPTSVGSRRITHVIAVMSGKGGVGKSAVAGLLASALQRRNLQAGVLDADITGPSIPKIFGADQPPSLGPEGI